MFQDFDEAIETLTMPNQRKSNDDYKNATLDVLIGYVVDEIPIRSFYDFPLLI